MNKEETDSLSKETQYYIAPNRQQQGPYDFLTILSFISRGEVKPDTLVWKAELPNWVQIVSLPEFADEFAPEDNDEAESEAQDSVLFCSNCGARISAEMAFCPNCCESVNVISVPL